MNKESSVRLTLRTVLSLPAARRALRALDIFGSLLIRTTVGAWLVYLIVPGAKPVLCSDCLTDVGLRLDAEAAGIISALPCPNCGSRSGKRLTRHLLDYLLFRFFVRGSVIRGKYGSAPWLQFNRQHFGRGDYDPPEWLRNDLRLLTDRAGVGVFQYGPRLWMLGEIEPLKQLESTVTRTEVVARIVKEYPEFSWPTTETFFRVRVNPRTPSEPSEYDSPPVQYLGQGRLDSTVLPVLYCSQDIEGCVHECRVTVEDEVYVATLQATRALRLLDLTAWIEEGPGVTEFESLDMAIHMLFFASDHSYEVSRDIAIAAQKAGFDGLLYPSYFSQVRSGRMPYETAYGISLRRFPGFGAGYAKSGVFPNLAIFGRPLADATIRLKCINRVVLSRVEYRLSYGPAVQHCWLVAEDTDS
jgi:hypothetical protein